MTGVRNVSNCISLLLKHSTAKRSNVCSFNSNSLSGWNSMYFRSYVEKIVKTPFMADSITQGTLASWEKKVGEFVKQDETVANIETDKVTIPVNSPDSGVLVKLFAVGGDIVQVGSDLFVLDPDAKRSHIEEEKVPIPIKSVFPKNVNEPTLPPTQSAVIAEAVKAKEDKATVPSRSIIMENLQESTILLNGKKSLRTENREKMTRMRLRIAERLKESQNTAASLTTFNEIDMSALINLRNKFKDDFVKKHGTKLGFMSPFVKAAAQVLTELPAINARLDSSSQEIVYHNFVDISVAVATPKGLVTPILRNCESLSIEDIERTIAQLGEKARDNKISIEELTGGTFTISNGGVFGSLMGTPIINSPQTAILGMHAVRDRCVAIDGRPEVRPMMYVALTYDHRLVDGREAVTFLVRLKQLLEDPLRMLINL